MAKKCKFSFYSQSDKECVYAPSIGSDFCIWHDPEIKKDQDFVPLRLKSAIKETGGDLEGFLLRKANLSGINLRDVDLRDADLREANIEGADCRGADFRGAKLNRVSASSTNFEGANFMAANLSDGVFNNASFKDCNMRITNLGRSDIRGADFTGSDLRNTDFSETHQDGNTNFYNVTGITAKIVKGEEEPAEKPSGGPPTTPMSRPGTEPQVVPGTSFPIPAGVQAEAPAHEEIEPFSDVFDKLDDGLLGPDDGITETGSVMAPDPLTAQEENESVDAAPVFETKAEEPTEETRQTALTGKKSEDETDFGIKIDGTSTLTKKHPFKSSRVKKLVLIAVLLLGGLGGGLFLESKLSLVDKVMHGSIGTGGESRLGKQVSDLTKELKGKESELDRIHNDLKTMKQEIDTHKKTIGEKEASIQKLINEAKNNGGGSSNEAVRALEQKNKKLEEKVNEWKARCDALSSDAKAKDRKMIRMAVEATKYDRKINEITQTNKRLVQGQSDLQQQLKEGKVLLEEYKKRLAKAEDSYKELLVKVLKAEDPFTKEHPLSFRIAWGAYSLVAPPKEKYIAGIKFSRNPDGAFLYVDLMIVGKTPRSKPNFSVSLFGKSGNQLARTLKVDYSEKGLKYQEVKLLSRGWRSSEEEPVYFQVKFVESK